MVDTSRNKFCGPFAVAHILGLSSTAEAAELLHRARWGDNGHGYSVTGARRPIRGAHNGEVLRALAAGGVRAIEWDRYRRFNQKPTLAAFLKGRRGGLYLVNVTGHYIVVDGHRIYDNVRPLGTKRKDWPHRRKRVVAWWRFR